MQYDLSDWTLVFDLDGTLVETAPDLHAALNHTLKAKKLGPVSLDSIRLMIGDGAKAMIRKGLTQHGVAVDETEIEQHLWPRFLEHYQANITRLSEPFEDSVASLDTFRAAGARMAVCTNKAQHLAAQVLSGLNLDRYFVSLVGGDTLGTKKPDGMHVLETVRRAGGSPERAIMIGDAWTDEKAARNAGLPFIFVSFGYGTLSAEPYEFLKSISHWRDMPQAIAELAGLI
ncbi:MAG: HAD-IA family hydrolase [Hyphomonadaceae bacterium]|nr:HAD-IA family hydrolase [Hyphomonadaceae bacterium]